MKKLIGLGLIALVATVVIGADVESVNTRQGFTTLYEVQEQLNNLAGGGTLTNGVTVEGGVTVSDGVLTVSGAFEPAVVVVDDTNAYTVLAANSGKVHFMPDLTADSTFTLPDAAAGLQYGFVYMGGAGDAQDWLIDTGADANYFVGGLCQLDADTDSSVIQQIYSDGDSNSKLTVYTPEAGTSVRIWCQDGTTWYVSGIVASDANTGLAFGDQ
jgi:hypothetical protein